MTQIFPAPGTNNPHNLTTRERELLKAARSQLNAITFDQERPWLRAEKYTKIEEIIAQIEKLLGA